MIGRGKGRWNIELQRWRWRRQVGEGGMIEQEEDDPDFTWCELVITNLGGKLVSLSIGSEIIAWESCEL